MKVALIADVHANLPALEAVMEHARRKGCEAFWNVGDSVGYGAFPEEVVAILRRQAVNVIGNYDRKVLEVKKQDAFWRETGMPEKRMAFNWAYDHLSEESRKWLSSLPEQLRMEVEGKRILLLHASPLSAKEHLSPETPLSRFEILAEAADADLVVCGHSHRPFSIRAKKTVFVNPGSVGRPDDQDARAAYATLTLRKGRFRLCQYRVPYDVKRAADEARRRGLPEAFAQMLLRGVSLSSLLEEESPGRGDLLLSARKFAELCGAEAEHARQVERLALKLFDLLKPLHGLGKRERFLLQCAAILHDIGWVKGGTGHHKTSLRLIREAPQLGCFSSRERGIIGSIARYHRGKLPSEGHSAYGALSEGDRFTVCALASLLRLADGMDASHGSVVREIALRMEPGRIFIECRVSSPAFWERESTEKKKDLFELTFRKELKIEWSQA